MPPEAGKERMLGRYALHGEIASGGMASVHFGRLLGPVGFARTVAIKRLHPQFARDHEFVAMFLDEARLAARVRHPNVATVSDVIATDDELFLVMEYVHGVSVAELARAAAKAGGRIPPRIAAGIVHGALSGLHAAHTATSETGEPLGIVHRDVSPENLIVGVDGITRVLDFGIAFAAQRAHHTREGQIKGKLGYTAPELLEGVEASPQVDVYSAGVVLWEATVGRRLFTADNEVKMLGDILRGDVPPPTTIVPELPLDFDAVALQAMRRRSADRYPTADAFAIDVERRLQPAPPREIGAWVAEVAREGLARRATELAAVEGVRPARDPKSYPPRATPRVAVPRPGPGGYATEVKPLAFDDATVVDASSRPADPTDPTVSETTRTDVDALPLAQAPAAPIRPAPAPTVVAASTSSAITEPVAPRRSAVTWERVALALALVALVALATRSLSSSGEAPSAARAPASTTQPAEAPVSSAPPAVSTQPSAAAPAASSAGTATAAAPSASPTRPRNGPAADRLKRPGCNPPYTVDESGHHHFKPSCL